jgi:hypothetical protein
MYEAAASCKDIAQTPRNKLGTAMCNARGIRLHREARNESSARNSVSCESLATLRRYSRGYVTSVDPPLERVKPCLLFSRAVTGTYVSATFMFAPCFKDN